MPEARSPGVAASQAHSLRLALIGGTISGLGLLASLRTLNLLSWFWVVSLLACLAYAWYSVRAALASRDARESTPAAELSPNAHPSPAALPVAMVEEARFLSSAGHDMRQPLQAISLFSATLAAHPLPPESAKLVSGIEQAAESLSGLFEAVMALARLNAGRVQLQRREVVLDEVLARCVAERMEAAQDKGIHLRHVPTRLRIMADETQLLRALDCLVAHALATTGSDGGVVIGCRRCPCGLRIEVWDNGKAVPAAALEQLFEPFSDYGQSFDDRGLGLVLARRLLTEMGGQLDVGLTRGGGKRLVMRLPR